VSEDKSRLDSQAAITAAGPTFKQALYVRPNLIEIVKIVKIAPGPTISRGADDLTGMDLNMGRLESCRVVL
jgi:hypothetical protein